MQLLADSFEVQRLTVVNKTGAALVKGGIYALDITKVSATTLAQQLSYITGAVTANMGGILVVSETTTANGDECQVVVSGPVKALVDGTTDVAIGDRLKAVTATTALVKASAAVGSVDVGVGIALAARATDSAGLLDILFDGECFNKVINGAVS